MRYTPYNRGICTMEKRLLRFVFFLLFLCLHHTGSKAWVLLQAPLVTHHTDSLLQLLKTFPDDTNRVNTLNNISRQYLNVGDYDEALAFAEKAAVLAEKLNYTMGRGNAYSNIGGILWYLGEHEKALEQHFKAIELRNQCGDIQGVGNTYNNIGLVYMSLSDYEKSLESFLKALKIREEMGDRNGTAGSYNNIGIVYQKQNNYNKAIENYEKGLEIRKITGDVFGLGMSYNNVGLIYLEKGEYLEAAKNLLKGLEIREEIGDKRGLADSYLNLGTMYYAQKKYEKSLEYFYKAAGINERIGNKRGIGISYINIGTSYLFENRADEALLYLNKGLAALKEIANKDGMKDAYSALSAVYDKKGDYKKAYEYQSLYADLKDTLFDEQVSEQMTEMNAKYESERKNKEIIKKDAEIERQQAETDKQRILRNAFIISFLLVAMLAFFIYRGYRQKQVANRLLDSKNEKITDSINYAKRIQESIFPPLSQIRQSLPDFFVFLQPKDIVSGDFYWFTEIERHKASYSELPSSDSKLLLLAAVDCTGHGVPGAFMSMMAYNLLEQVVKKHHVYQPAAILNDLSKCLAESLRQTNQAGKINDGMDIALVSLIQKEDKKWVLEYAGAHNSLYLIRNGVLHETKANRASIGLLKEKQVVFTNHIIPLEKGDCCYLFTDGFVDQFGGPKYEKFYYQPFRDLLVEIHNLKMEEQQLRLQQVFADWKSSHQQVDDVLIVGFRI